MFNVKGLYLIILLIIYPATEVFAKSNLYQIKITTAPPGAKIYAEGQLICQTNPSCILNLTKGLHKISITLEEYEVIQETVSLSKSLQLYYKLSPKKASPVNCNGNNKCPFFSTNDRAELTRQTGGKLNRFLTALYDACTQLQLTELVKQINEKEQERAKRELWKAVLDIAMVGIFAYSGPRLTAEVSSMRANPDLTQYHTALDVYLKYKDHKIIEAFSKKSQDFLAKQFLSKTSMIDVNGVSAFCDAIKTQTGKITEDLDKSLSGISDLELMTIWLVFEWNNVQSFNLNLVVSNLFGKYKTEVLPLEKEYDCSGSADLVDRSMRSCERKLYHTKDDSGNEYLSVISRQFLLATDPTTTHLAFTMLAGSVSAEMRDLAMKKAETLGLSIDDFDSVMNREIKAGHFSIMFEWFPDWLRNRYKRYLFH